MAAGFVTINFLDGDGLTKTGRFWSSDGTTAGLLYPSPVLSDTAGAAIDWTAPSPIMGVDGATIATVANPFPVQVQTGSNVIGAVTQSGAFTVSGTGTAASPATGLLSIQGLQADDAALGATATNPVPVGGKYNATLPTYADGDRTQLQFTTRGEVVVGGSVASLGTDFGNPVKVGAVYNSTQPTVANGQRVDLQTDASGNLRAAVMAAPITGNDGFSNSNLGGFSRKEVAGTTLTMQSAPLLYNGSTWDRARNITASFGVTTGVAAVETAGSTFSYIPASGGAATTQVKSGAGILHKIIINTPVAGTISVIDNTAGSTVNIALITMTADVKPYELTYDLAFATGLRIITSVAADVTVVYR